jgi:hypothetical protein
MSEAEKKGEEKGISPFIDSPGRGKGDKSLY